MTTLNIGGKRVKVGDEFMSLSPEQQQATVDEIATSLGIGGDNQPTISSLPDVPLQGGRVRTSAEKAREDYQALPFWAKPIVAADDIATLGAAGIGYGLPEKLAANVRSWAKGTTYDQERGAIDKQLQQARDRSGGAGLVAEIGGAVVTPAKLASAGITATRIPKVGKYLGLTADGAAMGAADAYGHDQNVSTGALIGAGLGGAGDILSRIGGKVISPFVTSPERTAAGNVLKREGVDLTAGQRTGSQKLRYAESELGGATAQNLMEKQGEQFTKAVLKRVGVNADRATPDVIDAAFTKVGNEFNSLIRNNRIVPDQQIAADLTQIAVDYGSTVAPSAHVPIVKNAIDEAMMLLRTGQMAGKPYQAMRERLGRFSRQTNDPYAKNAVRSIIEALDGGMERTIQRMNPSDLGRWREARKTYRNMLVVEQAATGAGENAALGVISPSQLRNATVNKQGRRNYARGSGDFAELARAGEAILKPLPQSGTAPRLAARGIMPALGAAAGGGYGASEGGAGDAAKYALMGAAAPWLAGKALMSGSVQKYLANQSAANMSPEVKAFIARLLASGGTAGLLGYQ